MTKTTFGTDNVKQKTPLWAKWVFRVVFLLTTIATFLIAADPAISDVVKVRIGVYLKGLDMLVFGLSKMVGVTLNNKEDAN